MELKTKLDGQTRRLNGMETELEELEETVESLREDVAGMNSDLKILRHDKVNLEAACDSLKQLLEEKGKQVSERREEEAGYRKRITMLRTQVDTLRVEERSVLERREAARERLAILRREECETEEKVGRRTQELRDGESSLRTSHDEMCTKLTEATQQHSKVTEEWAEKKGMIPEMEERLRNLTFEVAAMQNERNRLRRFEKSSSDGRETPSTQSSQSVYNPRYSDEFRSRTFSQSTYSSSAGDLYSPLLFSDFAPGPSGTNTTSQSRTPPQQQQQQQQQQRKEVEQPHSPLPNGSGTSPSPTDSPRQQPQSPRPNRILNPSNSPPHSPTVPPRQQNNSTITLQPNPKFNPNLPRQTRQSSSRRSSVVPRNQPSPTNTPTSAKRPRTAAPTADDNYELPEEITLMKKNRHYHVKLQRPALYDFSQGTPIDVVGIIPFNCSLITVNLVSCATKNATDGEKYTSPFIRFSY